MNYAESKILPVLQYPHPVLRMVSDAFTPEEIITDEFKQLTQGLLVTVVAANGAAISAVQVGIPKRVIVLHPSFAGDIPDVLVNPELLSSEGEALEVEGCLSMASIRASVPRATRCVITALTKERITVQLTLEGQLARAVLHELDHLDGRLIVDLVKPVKREMINRRMKGRAGNAVRYGQSQ